MYYQRLLPTTVRSVCHRSFTTAEKLNESSTHEPLGDWASVWASMLIFLDRHKNIAQMCSASCEIQVKAKPWLSQIYLGLLTFMLRCSFCLPL